MTLRRLAVVALVLVLGALPATRGIAGPSFVAVPGSERVLLADQVDQFSFVPPQAPPGLGPSATGPTSATFVVNYTGFTPEAQAAFQYAVDIWASQLSSSVPIVVNATFAPLGQGVLGSAGPVSIVRDFDGAPESGTWYPVALANKLAGEDLIPDTADISAQFSSTFGFYFGTDGNVPAGKYDFVSVVLHELGHGVGFISSFRRTGSFLSYRGTWGSSGYPYAFDPFVVNGSNLQLLSNYANNSTALLAQLTSNDLYFNGAAAIAANGGTKPKLYAPASWASGSSISHWDESTYPAGNVNSLMTPAIGSAEAIHNLGPITRGSLVDNGWTASTALAFTQAPAAGVAGQPFPLQPVVAVVDNTGNPVAGDGNTAVTLALASGAGTLTCTGGLTRTVSAGVAAFTGCAIDTPGAVSLRATSLPLLPAATTASFQVSPVPAGIVANQLGAAALGAEVAVFGRNPANDLWYRETAGGSFGPWTLIPTASTVASAPVPVFRGDGDLYVFFRGPGADLRYAVRDGGGPAWASGSLGGFVTGDPVAAVDGDGDIVVLVTGASGQLWYRGLAAASDTFDPWTATDGAFPTSNMALAEHGGDLVLAGLDGAAGAWTRTWSAATDTWGAWTSLGGYIESAELTLVSHAGSLHFLVLGGGGALFSRTFNSAWSPWQAIDGALARTFAAVSSGSVFVAAGVNSAGSSWSRTSPDGSAWGAWTALGGVVASDPELVATSAGAYYLAQTADGGVWSRFWNGASWDPWVSLGGAFALG